VERKRNPKTYGNNLKLIKNKKEKNYNTNYKTSQHTNENRDITRFDQKNSSIYEKCTLSIDVGRL
jgi:hypothetical protein